MMRINLIRCLHVLKIGLNLTNKMEGIVMTKILSVNAGSSSLKFQLLEMPAQTVITKGLVERNRI